MKNTKLILSALLALIVTLSISAGLFAMPDTLYEKSEEKMVTRGVSHEKITRLTEDGWLSINVLRVNLKDRHLRVDSLYGDGTINRLITTQRLAENSGAIAAINGGYFEWVSGGGSAIGTIMKSGVVDSAFGETNLYGSTMGSITISKNLDKVLFAYCIPRINIFGGGSEAIKVNSYNKKCFYDHNDVCVYDKKYRNMSVGATEAMPNIVELVVKDGTVVEVRDSMPAVEIPENGFVAVTRKNADGAHPFTGAFAVGSKVSFSVELSPSIEDAYMHVEGTSMLLKNGSIPEAFTYDVYGLSGRNPRTMIGANESGDELILVTVDGRQSSSIGLDATNGATLMKELGAYNALGLDGGGSTTMAVRGLGDDAVKTVNSVSDSSQRAILNAIGIFSDAPQAALYGLVIEAAEYNVFVGTQRQFTVKAYDRYYNPIELNQNDILWSVAGFEGSIKNGLLTPKSAGDGEVRVRAGRARASVKVKSLAGPSQLVLNRSSLGSLKPGESHTFTVSGRDNLGYSARINPVDVKWSVSGSVGTIEKGVFKRESDGQGYIKAEVGGAIAYCTVEQYAGSTAQGTPAPAPVSVPNDKTRVVDSANVPREYKASAGAFRFGVYGEAKTPATSAENKIVSSFAGLVNRWLDLGVFVGGGSHSSGAGQVSKKALFTDVHFEVHDDIVDNESVRFVRLSSVGGGIRRAGKYQWGNFQNALNTFEGDDLFVFLQQPPSAFSDPLEAQLFKTVMEEASEEHGYNVWVFYAGATDSVWLENGVRYFSCAGMGSAQANPETGAGAMYLLVTYIDGRVTYEYKSVS